MTQKLSSELLGNVEKALDDTGRPLREVHERVGMWARTTTAHALRRLVEDGRATFHQHFGGPRLYRRIATP